MNAIVEMLISQSSWLIFFTLIILLILFDLVVLSKFIKHDDIKHTSISTLFWVLLAICFAFGIYFKDGYDRSLLFVTGYVIELALSMDNIFVFILIFEMLKIPTEYQHKVLFIGIISAIVMRLFMITAGVYLVSQFEWLFYIFGVFLIYSGIKIFVDIVKHSQQKQKTNWMLNFLSKHFPVSSNTNTHQFFIKENGKILITPLLIALIMIEQSDLIFALDSIPAILAITDDIFIIFTSNVFAILGLRSMYFMLSTVLNHFIYLKHSLAFMLTYIGCKMIAAQIGFHIPTLLSLSIIMSSLAFGILFSILKIRFSR